MRTGSISKRIARGAVALTVLALATACTTDPITGERKLSKTAIGAGVGAASGAAVGALIDGDRGRNAAIGAGVGTLAGAGVGYYMDRQEAKLRERLAGTGVSVTRVGDNIVLNMPGNVTFDTDQAAIKPQFFDVLNSVALVLKEFEKTLVHVAGHTDSTGPLQYNMDLSQRRAESVAAYLRAQGIVPQRILTQGFGPDRPVASNATPEGRAQNRRVEITLEPLTR